MDEEWQPDLFDGPGVPAERTPPLAPVAPPPPPKEPDQIGSGRWGKSLSRAKAVAIVRQVSEEYRVAAADILGPSRILRIAQARHEVYWRLRRQGAAWSAIGRFMDRDHSTCIHGAARSASAQTLFDRSRDLRA